MGRELRPWLEPAASANTPNMTRSTSHLSVSVPTPQRNNSPRASQPSIGIRNTLPKQFGAGMLTLLSRLGCCLMELETSFRAAVFALFCPGLIP